MRAAGTALLPLSLHHEPAKKSRGLRGSTIERPAAAVVLGGQYYACEHQERVARFVSKTAGMRSLWIALLAGGSLQTAVVIAKDRRPASKSS